MDAHDQEHQSGRHSSDIILFQHISGGWEFLFTASDGMSFRGFHRDPALAKTRLLRQLGWDQQRFNRAEFRRF